MKKPFMASELSPVWVAIYEQVNDYLRESGKKRDQLIAFNLLLLAAVIGAWDKLAEFREVALFGVWLIGLMSYLVATQYWRWHVVLTCSMITIQRLMARPAFTLAECEKEWNVVIDAQTLPQLMSPLRGIESAMLYVLATITLVPAHLFLKVTGFSIFTVSSDWLAFILNAAIYVPILVAVSAYYVKRFYSFRENEWPFRWLRQPKEENICD